MMAEILVGMSGTEVADRADLAALARARGASLAFLQMGDPALTVEMTRHADAGATSITLVGVSLGPLGPAVSWLRRIAAYWWRECPGQPPEVLVATRLAQTLAEVEAVSGAVKAIHGREAGLTSAAWEAVPGHRHQVLICRGPRCTARGGLATARALILATMTHDLGDDDVLITHTGCQFPCSQAPVISVQPDDVWYGAVDGPDAEEIVSEHLVAGRPVERLRLPRVEIDADR